MEMRKNGHSASERISGESGRGMERNPQVKSKIAASSTNQARGQEVA